MRLRQKFLLLLLPLVIIPLVILGVIAYLELNKATDEKVLERLYTEIEYISHEIEERAETAVVNIELFAKNKILQKYVLHEDVDSRYSLLHGSLMRVFQTYQEAYPDYYEIRLLMPDGTEDVRRTTKFIPNHNDGVVDKQFIEQMTNTEPGSIYTSFRHNPDNGKYSLYVAKPLWLSNQLYDPLSAQPHLRGYLVLTISLDEIADHIEYSTIDNMGFWLLVDSEGRALFKPEHIAEDSGVIKAFINRRADKNEVSQPGTMKLNGKEILSVTVSPHRDLYLIANYPLEELQGATRKLALSVLAVILIAITLTTIFIYMLVHRLVIRRVQLLGSMTNKIAQGEMPEHSGITQRDEIGDLTNSIESMSETLQSSRKKAHHLAYHDSLTGLPNRRMFIDYLNRVIAHYNRAASPLHMAVLFLDLDDFKLINDIQGHEAGDAVLRHFARRIKKVLRKDDLVAHDREEGMDNVVARLGGDEFVMLLVDIKNDLDAHTVAERVIKATAAPIGVNGKNISTSTSIGISLYPQDAKDSHGLLKGADMAMYHSKKLGRNNIQFYTQTMNEAITRRIAIQKELHHALETGQFEVYYQPQVDTSSKLITGLEALVRWNKPDEGVVLPRDFITIAEESRLIFEIGEFVMLEVCRQIRQWRDAGLRVPPIAVNVSAKEMRQHDLLCNLISSAMESYNLHASDLVIELTESTIFSHQSTSEETLAQLHQAGLRIHLDDFGTGYSSLSHLQQLPVSAVKIDRSFIQSLDTTREDIIDKSIVSATIALAHALDIEVIAEGVEEKYQLDILTALKCDKVQGFLFYKPCNAKETKALLVSKSSLSEKWFTRSGSHGSMVDTSELNLNQF